MDNVPAYSPSTPPDEASVVQTHAAIKLLSWPKSLKIPQRFAASQEDLPAGIAGKSTFSLFTNVIGLKSPPAKDSADGASATTQPSFLGTITKGIVDSSKNAVKAVQVNARDVVSENKRRYQEGGFDLGMNYITENINAIGLCASDTSSGFFAHIEGLYRNHMEEVIKFFDNHHKKSTEEILFETWMMKFGKTYHSLGEKQKRFKIFKKKLKRIEEHNSVDSSYKLGLNEFSDWTKEEFSRMCGSRV